MDLKYKVNGINKKLELSKINVIVGPNNSNKKQLLELFYSGFRGKEDEFLVDGLACKSGMYNCVLHAGITEFENERNMKQKSKLYKKIVDDFIVENREDIKELFDSFSETVKLKINESSQLDYDYNLSNSKVTINSQKYESLENYLFKLVSENDFSDAAKEEFILRTTINSFDNSLTNILLIDNIDQYLDLTQIKKVTEIFKEKSNLVVIATTKNPNLLCSLEKKDKIFTASGSEISLERIAKYLILCDNFELEKQQSNFEDYCIDNSQYIIDQDINNFLLKEKYNIIKYIEEILINNCESSDCYNEKYIEIIKKLIN